jgi:hypothetical protein
VIPWRYTAGQIPDVLLDPQLAAEMCRTRVAVYEEQQTDLLLGDLRTD